MLRHLIFASVAFAPTALAEGPFDDFRAALTDIGDQRLTCLDFNGTWTGTCEVTEASSSVRTELRERTREVSMTFVQQGCATISALDFGLVQIGATRSQSASSARGASTTQSSAFWKDDGSLAMIEDMQLARYEGEGIFYHSRSEGSFRIADGMAMGTIKNTLEQDDRNSGMITVNEETQTCRLAKAE